MVEQDSQYDELLAEKAKQFAQLGLLGPTFGVNTVILEGNPQLVGREDLTRVLIVLIPQINQEDYFATMMFVDEDSLPKYNDKGYYYERILSLVLSNPPVHGSFVEDNILERLALEQTCARTLTPSRMVEICRKEDSGEEAVALYCVRGIAPHTALEEIQNRVRHRLQSISQL